LPPCLVAKILQQPHWAMLTSFY